MTRGTDAGAVDPERLKGIHRVGGPDLVVRMVDAFRTAARDSLERLVEASLAGNLEACRPAAHALRSTALNLGAHRLADAAGRIERSESGEPPTPESVEDIRAALELAEVRLLELQAEVAG